MEGLRELVLQDSAEFLEKELKAKPGKLKAKVGLVRTSGEETVPVSRDARARE